MPRHFCLLLDVSLPVQFDTMLATARESHKIFLLFSGPKSASEFLVITPEMKTVDVTYYWLV